MLPARRLTNEDCGGKQRQVAQYQKAKLGKHSSYVVRHDMRHFA